MSTESRTPELQASLLVTGVDKIHPNGRSKSSTGGWRSAYFILGGGILENFAFYGINANLINFLTGQLEESVAIAAANVNTWSGVVSLVPILGAVLADSFIGRYRSIIIFSILYILGIGFLSLSATIISSSSWSSPANEESAWKTLVGILVFVSLYIAALAQGYKTCLQAFGADQFDGNHLPEKSRAKSSFFNWWTGGVAIGGASAHLILHYIQDNISWGIGFGIPCLSMVVGLFLFLLGNRTYRFPPAVGDEESSIARITDISHNMVPESSNSLDSNNAYCKRPKPLINLLPIWISCLTYSIARAQSSTLFIKQATTLDRSMGPNLNVPAATLTTFVPVSIVLFMAIYDGILVPVARKLTRYTSGITMLERMGTGMAISIFNMVISAVIEHKRLKTARDHGLVDLPNATVPMSFWWLIPQFILVGLIVVFAEVGMLEFFYDQVPTELRTVGLSFYYGALGIGNFLSSFLVFVIDRITSHNGNESWFSNNLNRAHIDYFYWLLAGIGAAGFIVFLQFSKSYNKEKYDLQKFFAHEETS